MHSLPLHFSSQTPIPGPAGGSPRESGATRAEQSSTRPYGTKNGFPLRRRSPFESHSMRASERGKVNGQGRVALDELRVEALRAIQINLVLGHGDELLER